MESQLTIPVTHMFYYAYLPLVVLEACIALGAIGGLVGLCIKAGFRKRYLIYLHEILFLILYLDYVMSNPIVLEDSLVSVLYWSSLVSFAPLLFLPVVIEWKRWVWNRKESAEPRRIGRAYLLWSFITLCIWFVLAYVLRVTARTLVVGA